jgi:phosphonate transport system substrate-binding protein
MIVIDTFRRFLAGFAGLSCLVPVAVGLLSLPAAAQSQIVRFGSYASERPSEEMRKLEPFQRYIETSLLAQGFDARVDVRIFPTYEEGIDAMASGDIDFSRLGPVSYVTAKQKNPALILLAAEAQEGDKEFPAVMVVPKDSPIRTVADLRGKRFAFGDPLSTSGRYLPQAELVKAGITAKGLAEFEYLGRHDKVVFAVASGRFDAGATNINTFRKYADSKNLRELVRYPSPTHAWVARNKLAPALVNALRKALLEMTDPRLQELIDRNGFLPATDADYDGLRRVMNAAKEFGG